MIIPSPFHHLYQSLFSLPHLLEKEINRFYFVFLIRNFTVGMIAIFEPIYFFNYFHGNISRVLVFYAVLFGGAALFCYWAVRLISKLGIKRSIILSFPFGICYYLFLWNIEKSFIFLFMAVIFWLITVLLFWMAINVYFGITASKSRLGVEVGKFNVLFGLSFAMGPVAGGLILNHFGWSALFATVVSALFITSLALFFSPEIHERYDISLKQLARELLQRDFLKRAVAFAATGGEHVTKAIIWPIFLFLLGIRFDSIGIIATGALLVGTIFILYVGALSDRLPRPRLIATGSFLLSFSWILKTLVRTPVSAFMANIFYGVASAAASVPFMAMFYEDFGVLRSQSIVLREITLNIGRMLILLCFAAAFLYTDKLYLAFFVAASIVPLFNLIHMHKK